MRVNVKISFSNQMDSFCASKKIALAFTEAKKKPLKLLTGFVSETES